MNKVTTFFLALILIIATLGCAYADEPTPYADEIFDIASINLKSSKKVTFTGVTYGTSNSISITSCWLQTNITGDWLNVRLLPLPPSDSNTSLYSEEMDYSSYIDSGTFRIKATFNADGHAITRYSNSRSF